MVVWGQFCYVSKSILLLGNSGGTHLDLCIGTNIIFVPIYRSKCVPPEYVHAHVRGCGDLKVSICNRGIGRESAVSTACLRGRRQWYRHAYS